MVVGLLVGGVVGLGLGLLVGGVLDLGLSLLIEADGLGLLISGVVGLSVGPHIRVAFGCGSVQNREK